MKEFNYGGTLTPVYEKPKFLSTRGLPLITQNIDNLDGGTLGILTMENYDKWYSMYIIHVDGSVEEIHEAIINDVFGVTWIDHAISPRAFHETAINLGLEYDNHTFAMVCERFVEDILDNSWSRLVKYLPKD